MVCLAITTWVFASYWFELDDTVTTVWPGLSLGELLGGDPGGFAQVLEPRALEFPRDHGAHHEYRTEWWYFTGNLDDEQGRHFGFQLTFFRVGLDRPILQRKSAWAMGEIYMGHFALTDVSADKMRSFERLSRDAMGLAGVHLSPFAVWIDHWRVESTADAFFPLSLHASEGGIALTLTLATAKPVVLQGDRGMSQKGPTPGNASFYYSFTRLAAEGTLTVANARPRVVTGEVWMDREWSTSALAENQVGWDWFSIQLDDKTELMFYRLRRDDGTSDPHSAGVLVDQRGRTHRLAASDVILESIEEWVNSAGVSYPVRWVISVPEKSLRLEVDAYVFDQEINHSVRYWEGAVSAHGLRDGRPVAGKGYLEMTGYADFCTQRDC